MFGDPVVGCGGQVVFSDQGLANYIGVGEGGGWVGEDVVEGDSFVLTDVEDRRFWIR